MAAGPPGLGEGGGDARRVVRGPGVHLGGDLLEKLAVDGCNRGFILM